MPEGDHNHDGPAHPGTEPGAREGTRSASITFASKPFVLVAVSLSILLVAIVLVLQYFVAERLPLLTEANLEAAQELWRTAGPASYDLDLKLGGARPGIVHVEVRNQTVTAETRDGRVPGKWTWETWSVAGLFDTLSQDLDIAQNPEERIQAPSGTKWSVRCEFDPKFGYPRRYHRLVTGGPEVFWNVTHFEPK